MPWSTFYCWCCFWKKLEHVINKQSIQEDGTVTDKLRTSPRKDSGFATADIEAIDDSEDYAVELTERVGSSFFYLVEPDPGVDSPRTSTGAVERRVPLSRKSSSSMVGGMMRWSKKFVQAVSEAGHGLQAAQAVWNLTVEFVRTAQPVAEAILREAFKSALDKTVEPLKASSSLGDVKFVANGIVFTFALSRPLDKQRDNIVMKIASHEMRGAAYWLYHTVVQSPETTLCFPLMAIFESRGLRLVAASAIVPDPNSRITYGTVDGGRTHWSEDEAVAKELARVGTALNLRGHYVGAGSHRNTPGMRFIHTPADMQVITSTDSSPCVLGFSRVFPPEAPYAPPRCVTPQQIRTSLLRPELVRTNECPLSSDAFLSFAHPQDRVQCNEDVRLASTRLIRVVIPDFLKRLETGEIPFPPDNGCLVFYMHDGVKGSGINVRHFGTMFKLSKHPVIRDMIFAEMLSRVYKNDLLQKLRDAQTSSENQLKAIAVREFARVGRCTPEDWKSLRDSVKLKFFKGFETGTPELDDFDLFSLWMTKCAFATFRRVQSLSGVRAPFEGSEVDRLSRSGTAATGGSMDPDKFSFEVLTKFYGPRSESDLRPAQVRNGAVPSVMPGKLQAPSEAMISQQAKTLPFRISAESYFRGLFTGALAVTPPTWDESIAPTNPGHEMLAWADFTSRVAYAMAKDSSARPQVAQELSDAALLKLRAALASQPALLETNVLLAREVTDRAKNAPTPEDALKLYEEADALYKIVEKILLARIRVDQTYRVSWPYFQHTWGTVLTMFALALVECEQYEAAVRKACDGADKCPDSSLAWMALGRANHMVGIKQRNSKYLGDAIDAYSKASEMKDQQAKREDIFLNWGKALLECAQFDAGIGAKKKQAVTLCTYATRRLNTVLDINPNHEEAKALIAQAKSMLAAASSENGEEGSTHGRRISRSRSREHRSSSSARGDSYKGSPKEKDNDKDRDVPKDQNGSKEQKS